MFRFAYIKTIFPEYNTQFISISTMFEGGKLPFYQKNQKILKNY